MSCAAKEAAGKTTQGGGSNTSIIEDMEKLFKKLRTEFNTVNGPYWLPTQLQQIDVGQPPHKLLPLKESNWIFTLSGSQGSTFAETIYQAWWNTLTKPNVSEHQPIPDPAHPFPQLTLPAITVNGLENATLGANQNVKSTGALSFEATIPLSFGLYSQLSQIEIAGDYSIIQDCCSAPKAGPINKCDGFAKTSTNGKGDVKLQITDMVVVAVVDFSIVGKAFKVDVKSLTVQGPTDGLPNIKVEELTITNKISGLKNEIWTSQAKTAINSKEGRQGIFDHLKKTINEEEARSQISNALGKAVNHYLQTTHSYPYGPPPS